MLSLNLQSVVGIAERKSWSQAMGMTNQKNGGIGVCLRITREGEEGELQLGSVGSSVLAKLQGATSNWIQIVKKEMSELEENGYGVVVVAYEQIDNELSIWAMNGGRAYLYRDEKLAKLVESEKESENVKGEMKSGDVIMLGVGGGNNWSLELMRKVMNEKNNAKELLAREVHGGDWEKDVAIMIGNITNPSEQQAKKMWKMPQIKINRLSEEPRRFNLILGGVVIAVITILAVVGGIYRVKKTQTIEYEAKKEQVTLLIEEARTTVESNPERAKALLAQARETMETYARETGVEKYRIETEKILKNLETEEGSLLKVSGASLITTVELNVLEEGLTANYMVSDGKGNVYFWSDNKSKLIGINLKDKSRLDLDIEGGKKISRFAITKDRTIIVTDEGILEVENDVQKIAIERDEMWGEIGQVGIFGNNIYLLDLGNSEIWKYSALDSGYAERKRWLAAGIMLDLTKVIDWVVDGDIWLLTSSGKLERYSRGAPTKFEIIGFPSVVETGRFVDPVAIAIEGEKVYVLERGAKRVVTFDINGKYLGQQVAEDLGKADDLVVYEGKGYVLVNNVVKEFGL